MTTHQRLLQDSLLAAAEYAPGKVALVTAGERLTYAELLDRSLRLARALQDRGLERGDRVAIFLANGSPAVVSIFGTLVSRTALPFAAISVPAFTVVPPV